MAAHPSPDERERSGVTRTKPWESRSVAVPRDVDDLSFPKASGVVTLPRHVRWSGPARTYDLTDRVDRARVYEQVLREGTDDDVRRFIDLDELVRLWDDLFLPPQVRRAWAGLVREKRGIDLTC